MVSGKYSAVSGALAREQTINNIAANLANSNTVGFKKDRVSFSSTLRAAQQTGTTKGVNYTRIRTVGTDFSQGGLQTTGRDLDVAIDGPGFFKVRRGQDILYTRAGKLMLDDNGTIKTTDGYEVLGDGNAPLQIDITQGQNIIISETGEIAIDGVAAGAQLQVFGVDDPKNLVKVGQSLYRLPQGEGQPLPEARIVQGNLESSNVNMMEEMTAMISSQRNFEAHTKLIESYSKIGEKLDELGSIS